MIENEGVGIMQNDFGKQALVDEPVSKAYGTGHRIIIENK